MAPYKFKNLNHKEILLIETQFKRFFDFIRPITQTFYKTSSDSDSAVHDNFKKRQLPERLCPARGSNGKTPAQTVEELQAKLQHLKGKPSLAYKEKLQKKGLKARLRKTEKKESIKLKRLERKSQEKLEKSTTSQDGDRKVHAKPVFNQEGEMVFSKFDFSKLGAKDEKPAVKKIKDPAVALRKIKEEQARMKDLEEKGEKGKAIKIKEKKTWKNALLKAEGVKIKDDPDLLKTSIKKLKKRKEKSKAKWKANEKRVENDKAERQRKRNENLQARSRDKKLKKLKTLAKKGRVIAGF